MNLALTRAEGEVVRVLMLGWEFPPHFAGGVGTVCYQITKGLVRQGVDITYVMPHGPAEADHVRMLVADQDVDHVRSIRVGSALSAYVTKASYAHERARLGGLMPASQDLYGQDLLGEVRRFASAVMELAVNEEFDVIHAHDWTTLPAGLALKRATGKPLIAHAHICEFDKTGGEHADPEIYRIEREGFHCADLVIAVSGMLKQRLVERYGVPEGKIRVIHNAVEGHVEESTETIRKEDRVVLFLGRVTLQKGPDYFLEAAAKVAGLMPDVKFVIAGTGDMLPRMIERAAELGIGNRVIFTGFVSRDEGDRLYRMADLFVMPSVSEPFGIVPLEAMRQGTPVIISRQSGVSEVVRHALKVDFWDVEDLANKIVAALSYSALHGMMRHYTKEEIRSFTWDVPSAKCRQAYEELVAW